MVKLRGGRAWLPAALGLGFALLPGAASAQEVISSDTYRVMIGTAVVAVLVLIACAIGYAWRRMEGMDHPTPDELEMMGGEHGHAEAEHSAAAPH